MRVKKTVLFLSLFSWVIWWALAEMARAQSPAPQIETIRAQDLKSDLYFLASDEMRGRLAGSPENRLAAAFLKARFERLGLKASGPEGSYYQPFNVATSRLGEENRLAIRFEDGASLRLRPGEDYFPLRESASGVARGELVLVGFGISAPGFSHDDYREANVRGKVVLALEHEPGEEDEASPFEGVVFSEEGRTFRKILDAQERGAVGILFVKDVHNHPGLENFDEEADQYWPDESRRVDRFHLAAWLARIRIPAAQISTALAESLLRSTGRSLEELSRAAESSGGAAPVGVPGVEVEIETAVRRRIVSARNVMALVEGADSQLKDEWILVCAHFDHDGASSEQIYNGADDDGSGTVGLLEIAEAYASAIQNGDRPRRSVLLAAWNYEERGLLGSWAYTEDPLHPLSKTVAVLNMDMIGRNEEVPLGGGRRFRGLEVQTAESNANAVNILGTTRSEDLEGVVARANAGIGLELKLRYDNNPSNLLRRSDHWPFLHHGVPALFFHTGLHPDYHRQDDVPERINYEKMEKIVRLVYQTSWSLAQKEGRPGLTSP